MGFYSYFERKLSWHYIAGLGEDFFGVLGAALDETMEAVDQGIKQRVLSLAKDEALPYLGQNFNLDYPARFSATKARSYLANPWTHWSDAGSRARLVRELEWLGYRANVVTYRDLVDSLGVAPDVAFGGYSSFFYVILRPPFPFAWEPQGRWGPPPVGSGYLWGQSNPPKLWGLGGAAERWHLGELARCIQKWKPAATSCRFLEVWLTVDIFGGPIELRRFPVHEQWELNSNGGAREFYNNSYLQERT